MTDWEDLHPRLRKAVLEETRNGKTMTEVAAEIHVGRSTLFRMMEGYGGEYLEPKPAQVHLAEAFLESRSGLPDPDPAE